MCGRFAQSVPLGKLNKIDLYDEIIGSYSESYNLAPTQMAFTVSRAGEKRVLKAMKWGLVPSWAGKDMSGSGLINARFDTIAEKPSFRKSYKNRRCIIPVTGFYEWKKDGKLKTPYFINCGKDEDGDFKPMLLCGLYDVRISPEGEPAETFTIITTEASEKMMEIHDRMPLILDRKDESLWLGDDYNHDMSSYILNSFDTENLDIYRVSDLVNSYKSNTSDCILPV